MYKKKKTGIKIVQEKDWIKKPHRKGLEKKIVQVKTGLKIVQEKIELQKPVHKKTASEIV